MAGMGGGATGPCRGSGSGSLATATATTAAAAVLDRGSSSRGPLATAATFAVGRCPPLVVATLTACAAAGR